MATQITRLLALIVVSHFIASCSQQESNLAEPTAPMSAYQTESAPESSYTSKDSFSTSDDASDIDLADINAGKAWPYINFYFGVTTRAEVEDYLKKKGATLSNNKTPLGDMLVSNMPNSNEATSGYSFINDKLIAVHSYYPARMYDAALADLSKTLGRSHEAYNPITRIDVRAWDFGNSEITLGKTNKPDVYVITHTLKDHLINVEPQ